MSAYIKLSTLEYPRHLGDIRLEHPEIGQEFVCPDTYAPVQDVDEPEVNYETQKAYLLPPVNVGGGWRMVWAVRDLTAEELEERRVLNLQTTFQRTNTDVAGSTPDVVG